MPTADEAAPGQALEKMKKKINFTYHTLRNGKSRDRAVPLQILWAVKG